VKRNKIFIIALSLILALFAGFWFSIVLNSNGGYITWPFVKKGVYSDSPSGNIAHEKATSSDMKVDNETRCRAIFSLFAHHVHYGTDRAAFSGLFPDKSWVDLSNVEIVMVEGGKSALQGGRNCTHVVIFPFSKNGLRRWSIHLCLEGQDDEQAAGNFLKNSGASNFTRIKNFSLVYPKAPGSMRIEEFYWWGMRLENN
jgi:hypothetical protein